MCHQKLSFVFWFVCGVLIVCKGCMCETGSRLYGCGVYLSIIATSFCNQSSDIIALINYSLATWIDCELTVTVLQ